MAKTPASALMGLPEYEQHPVAIKLMPGGMSTEEFEALCEDVQERGILFPVTLHEGKVLDGWHRYRAGHKTGTQFKTIEYNGTDPAGYVTACNVLRRKLSSLQRALVGARLHLEHAVTQRDVCRRLGISNTVLAMVLKVIDSRNAVLIKRIENDSDYTRGMLREDLEDAGLVHANYGSSRADPEVPLEFKEAPAASTTRTQNSVFDVPDYMADILGEPMPTVGKKPSKPEHRVRNTPAQALQDRWHGLEADDRATFVQMVWNELRPVAEELGLAGLSATAVATQAVRKAKKAAA